MSDALLEIRDLDAFYGDAQALFSLSLTLNRGEMLALIGANGAGKSTLLKSIAGLVANKRGEINFQGRSIVGRHAFEIVAEGIALVPEGRKLFTSLSVEENLRLGGKVRRPGIWGLDAIYELFPVLIDKRNVPATLLSGGQQQMVAIGRALMSNPELLLIDELSLGLAPLVIKDIYDLLPKIVQNGLSAILVEQDVTRALRAASRFMCILEGRVSLEGRPADFSRDQVTAAYFGT
ncbi:ABC transporter ATP-binding protein [Bradyrhizobium sp. PRIMUS42]|uniref:ABC transporter ATP-binding protein n=1 Tax=Bradyrhizobium sp. PRIMUS42 TaxID=2908926 RepID=UPI001FF46982|nr:ABC transporter ATP-binding protein [Bradyrhizobium sp. PRIMUS42]MCJ9730227.1 ABC transporter ATP-binding protein [Bradyrhizobium sp. PRIMUS42]